MGIPDLSGKVCMITGATSGIGKAAALALAPMGPELVLVARDRERGEDTVDEVMRASGNEQIDLMLADLSSQQQIRQLAKDFLASDRPLHVLFNNAGALLRSFQETEDGIETTFAVNHLAYFLLTELLLDRLKASAPARIVSTASDAYTAAGGRLDFDDLESRKRYWLMKAYGKSKLENILFTRELAKRLEGSGVTANCFHPGFVGSNFAANNGSVAKLAMRFLGLFNRSVEKGAETGIYLCSSPEVENTSGLCFFDGKEMPLKDFAKNDEDARRLWDISEQMTGLVAS